MTNIERIKSLNAEKLATFLRFNPACTVCAYKKLRKRERHQHCAALGYDVCIRGIVEWLESEAEGDKF